MPSVTPLLRTNTELLQHEFDTITHNLANANTAGFKSRGNNFIAALQSYEFDADLGDSTPAETLMLTQQTDFSQGKLVHTGRTLDLALSGPGFFTIETPEGPLYTRNGLFHMNTNGQLVNSGGYTVAGVAGPITLPPTVDLEHIEITPNGTIKSGPQALGQIQVRTFADNENLLAAAGTSEFSAPEGLVPLPAGDNISVHQGYQEASNVNTVKELVGMMSVARLYEANMNFIKARREASQALMQVAMS